VYSLPKFESRAKSSHRRLETPASSRSEINARICCCCLRSAPRPSEIRADATTDCYLGTAFIELTESQLLITACARTILGHFLLGSNRKIIFRLSTSHLQTTEVKTSKSGAALICEVLEIPCGPISAISILMLSFDPGLALESRHFHRLRHHELHRLLHRQPGAALHDEAEGAEVAAGCLGAAH
jgi:hypothetical protein